MTIINDLEHCNGSEASSCHYPATLDPKKEYRQDPIAVVGLANRLPGDNNNPTQLWDFLNRGGVAGNDPPESRFSLKGHYDKSLKPHTIRTPGAMFLENIDPAEFDAPFFNINRNDAIAMDPQQRQLLEVVYEGLENAGLTMEQISGALYGCFVGSYAVDYQDMQFRDPEDRATGITVGAGRAILSNRISHFFNLKGASMTIDTACSGSLVSVDVACRYLQSRQLDGAIIAGANLYLSPDQNQDMGAMRVTSSATGKCHTFDAKADGYCKAEAINVVILKRLEDAIRDGDPIRAVIRGTSTNSDGWTPGIASPSAEAQAVAIRAAYSAAGITNFNDTSYLECHGTGTLAGDPIEVSAAASVFSPTRPADTPLIIGSIKSNIGHSEPAAGVNGLLKAVLAVEKGVIPGNPTFVDPNPKIDFEGLKVRATRTSIPWPKVPVRIASINSFGYGGSNAHVVLQDAESFLKDSTRNQISSFAINNDDIFAEEEEDSSMRPRLLVFSGNDEQSLKSYCQAMKRHLMNPSVGINLADFAFTLSEKRSHHFNRGYIVTQHTDLDDSAFTFGKKATNTPRVGFVFTGQGAQWSQMGKGVVDTFPLAKPLLERLDNALQSLSTPPKWSLLDELVEVRSPEHLRQPEFSQPLVTALQLVMLSVFESWGVSPQSVVGHSSGEIAAACAAGYLTPEDAIKVAFYRGKAAKDLQHVTQHEVGMLAVGVGADKVQAYINDSATEVQIACFNSPHSVTLSGTISELEKIKSRLQNDSIFARLLLVNLAYHSKFMDTIGKHYLDLLQRIPLSPLPGNKAVTMFSSVTGHQMNQAVDEWYWQSNMVSPVLFDQACQEMLSRPEAADFLIEIGPSGALAGPVSQIKKALPGQGSEVQYVSAAKRGPQSAFSMFDVAGHLFISGGSVSLMDVNRDVQTPQSTNPATIIDLPNYTWNHSNKYWHESDASKDWRFRPFVHHDLLGSKILGTPWEAPTFKKTLDLEDVPWLKDHKMGTDILFPAAGFIAMATEALYQHIHMTKPVEGVTAADQLRYRLRNVKFDKALVLEESNPAKIMLVLTAHPGTKDSWYDFKISSLREDNRSEHCYGLIRIEVMKTEVGSEDDLLPLKYSTPGRAWYKALADIGYGFGPTFHKQLTVESLSGSRRSRSLVALSEPASAWSPQSLYPMHPVCMDGCFQTVTPSLCAGDKSAIDAVLVPATIDNLVINPMTTRPEVGISVAYSEYTGRGRSEENKSYKSGCSVYDPNTGRLLLQLTGLHYHQLQTGDGRQADHTYNHSIWKPDVSFLSQKQLPYAQTLNSPSTLDQYIDLLAHKIPAIKVMEVNLHPSDTSSVWFQSKDRMSRMAYKKYSFLSPDPKSLISVKSDYEAERSTSFSLVDMTKPEVGPSETDFDLVMIKSQGLFKGDLQNVTRNSRALLAEGGYLLFIEQNSSAMDSDSDDSDTVLVAGESELEMPWLSKMMEANGFGNALELPCDNVQSAYLFPAELPVDDGAVLAKEISVAHISQGAHMSSKLKGALQASGWLTTEHYYPFSDIQPRSLVLVLDELSAPALNSISESHWNAIKNLVTSHYKILWVTEGSQLEVAKPDNALVHGLFRTIRAEDPSVNLTTLDVEAADTPGTILAIERVLSSLRGKTPKVNLENEFVERGGIIHISRILPDKPMNIFKNDGTHGPEPVTRPLHDIETVAMLRAERVGTLEELRYAETSVEEVQIKDGNVEVEIFAAGLNFKDVAVTMGIVPENQYLLGLEGAGTVRRVGKGADYKVGERVAVLRNGTFANRIQVPIERTHRIPNSLSFEDAATIPLVYLTSMYSLINVANLQKGQSLLIHSAAGGIGIACIQLAQYLEAEIYVTVGTQEKRKFLMSTFGISPARIFSSRTTKFASEIMQATNGKGIDVIINSLTGELLDESWRICADGGTMVEIGKVDIVNRNHLSMEPFDRNCSFRPVDFSHKQITDTLIASLLSQTFALLNKGKIKPIHPVKYFGFDEIAAAFAYMRSGRHYGKIVISGQGNANCYVPVRPAIRTLSLRGDVSYLIVGGLKGLCGSLAVHMAQHGAKHLIVMSRSGCADDASQRIVKNCNALGCQVSDAKGDVSNAEDVQRTFQHAQMPIAGVVQGAMVLRDKPYENMTVQDYHTTISNKVQGTWNLHNAALSQRMPLSFFTLLSSISGIVGQKGQANYAAANTFLDAFALYRRAKGLVANSVNLGVIEDVGYVAEQGGMQAHFDERQWSRINESVLRKIFTYSILQQSTTPINEASRAQLITGIRVPLPADSDLSKDARFGGLFAGNETDAPGKGRNEGDKDVQALLLLHRSGAEKDAVKAAAVEAVGRQFTKTLRLGEPVEPAKSLAVYGLDSLSAIEFRNWVRGELGAEVTMLEIMDSKSLYSLCDKIISKIALPAPSA